MWGLFSGPRADFMLCALRYISPPPPALLCQVTVLQLIANWVHALVGTGVRHEGKGKVETNTIRSLFAGKSKNLLSNCSSCWQHHLCHPPAPPWNGPHGPRMWHLEMLPSPVAPSIPAGRGGFLLLLISGMPPHPSLCLTSKLSYYLSSIILM